VFATIGLFFSVNATTALRISDNFETMTRARYAALAGISHARELLRGLHWNDLLRGPDGVYDGSGAYMNLARTHQFRNPWDWRLARTVDVADPGPDLPLGADDGIVNTGRFGSSEGFVLIRAIGIPQSVPDPGGAGVSIISRYFVKCTDNNGEASERQGDPADSPFDDGDDIILVRSLGISRTISEPTSRSMRNNSVAVYEARFKRSRSFDLLGAMVLQGSDITPASEAMFGGDGFRIWGTGEKPGVATVDTNRHDGVEPARSVAAGLSSDQQDNISGAGSEPSIMEVMGLMAHDPERSRLLDGEYLEGFVMDWLPRIADSAYVGNQVWYDGRDGDIGSYDIEVPLKAPTQQPRITLISGDLSVRGSIAGGGILALTGRLEIRGRLSFAGLILLLGQGELDASRGTLEAAGGIFLASFRRDRDRLSWGVPRMSLGGATTVRMHQGAIDMALGLLPPQQLGLREIHPSRDP
jgi:hypothetical protein